MPESAQLRLPELETSRLLAGSIFERKTDVSAKRNLGLLLSHMLRWERVVFLDDDIAGARPGRSEHGRRTAGTHAAVGLRIHGYPDNSVVCHAFRDAGGSRRPSLAAGPLPSR